MSAPLSAADLAARLNMKRLPRSWRGRCPACGYPGNTFSVRAGKSGRPLLFCANACNRDLLADAVGRISGGQFTPRPVDLEGDAEVRARKQERALALWAGSEPLGGTVAAIYLRVRHIHALGSSATLRFRGDCRHPEGGYYPALIALVQAVNGAAVAVHRTYLALDGAGKAVVDPPKCSLGPIWGGAIRLHAAAPEIVIGEGIETSAAAGVLLGLPAWAAMSAGNLAKGLALPPEIKAVVIAADPDTAGENAARAAALRWQAEGKLVRIARPTGGGDFADVLLERRHYE